MKVRADIPTVKQLQISFQALFSHELCIVTLSVQEQKNYIIFAYDTSCY